jgi:predicted Zn-dependent protease
LSRGFEWDVSVIDSPQVNAFCLPGGKMAVYTGLVPVAKNADAMAVVMGHEISHALLRHGAQRMAREQLESIGQMAGAASGMDQSTMQSVFAAYGYTSQLPYARGHETQADEIGLMLAAAACFNPEEAVALWERMEQAKNGQAPPEFASTHPSSATRIENLQRLMPKAMQYRARFCGAAGG